MQEENITGQQSLELIQSMINKARNQFSENGHLYLVWGWVILICSVGQFLLLHFFTYPNHYMIWMLTWLVVVYQFVYAFRKRKKEKVKTYTGDIVSYVWIVFVILMLMTGFLLSRSTLGNTNELVNPLILSLYGMPTFLSGKVLRFQPLIWGGISCWILSIVSTFIPYDFQLLFFGIAVIIAWIIPGYLLRKRYLTENS
jgi:FtsH-binding integral membrane protein